MEQPPWKAGEAMLRFSLYPIIRKFRSVQQAYSASLH